MDTNQNKATSPFKITGSWEAQSKALKYKFFQLTDADLKFEQGKENDLLKRLEARLSKTRDEVINIINKNGLEKKSL